MRCFKIFFLFLIQYPLFAQTYIVNTIDDIDNGVCDAVHCSLREAINASNADGGASRIDFNITGAGPYKIIPVGPLPNITGNFLQIVGESQPGPLGSVVIDFGFRNFGGVEYLKVIASDVVISGLTFSGFAHNVLGDRMIQIGDAVTSADRVSIYNNAFTNDNSLTTLSSYLNISVFNGNDVIIRKNIFGSDYLKSAINSFFSALEVNKNQGLKKCNIDSNIFVTPRTAINALGGDLTINDNIFGALDTNKANTFTNQQIGIDLGPTGQYQILNNFFIFHSQQAIHSQSLSNNLSILNNRFFSFNIAIQLDTISNANVFVQSNLGRNLNAGFGGTFLVNNSQGRLGLNIENNQVENLQNFYLNTLDPSFIFARHIKNRIICNENNPVLYNPVLFPRPTAPILLAVNVNTISGSSLPNDSISVYENTRRNCPSADCRGGIEIGRTQANGTGQWTLNVPFTNRASLSAYAYNPNFSTQPHIFSEFSTCYQCTTKAPILINPTICAGQNFVYRGRTYNGQKFRDTITIRGDGVNICDTIFHIDVNIINISRQNLQVNVCFGDTLFMGGVKFHQNHLLDSLKLFNQNGCDSTIIIQAEVKGFKDLRQTLCSNSSITIGTTVFDINNTSGTVILPNQATSGCDSIISVTITIKNFAESFINPTLCPGQDTIIRGTIYNAAKPTGVETIIGGSSTGCDSVININLKYANPVSTYIVPLCQGDSVLFQGVFYSARRTTGTAILVGMSANGCDSTIFFMLDLLPTSNGDYKGTICRGDTITIPGFPGEQFFSGRTQGTLKVVNGAANGCDSLIQVDLIEIPDAIGSFDSVLCDNQSLNLYGNIFDKQNPRRTIRVKDLASTSCDSFIMVNIQFISEKLFNYRPVICRKDSVKVGNQFFSSLNPTGSVRLIGQSVSGCDSVVDVSVTINPDLFADITAKELVCNQPNTGSLIINNAGGGTGNIVISLDNGTPQNYSSGITFSNLPIGQHTLRFIDQNGCDSTFSVQIINSALLTLRLPNDTTIKKGVTIDITAQINFNPGNIVWTPMDFLSCNGCLNPSATPDNTITYTLMVEDQNGCKVEDQITINVIVDQADIYLPNVFSPNHDQINDSFAPIFKFPTKTRISFFRIFDRWGELVFEKTNGLNGEIFEWNGEYRSKNVLPGVYVYHIQYVGEDNIPRDKTGDVTVLR